MSGATTNHPWASALNPDKLEAALQRLRDSAAAGNHGATSCMRYAHGDELFALYLHMADRKCQRATGLGIFDLADYNWRDDYDAATPTGEAVKEALAGDDIGAAILAEIYGRDE